jgi:hypothetical protein
MKVLILSTSFHIKNKNGLINILNYLDWQYDFGNVNAINNYDVIYSPDQPIDVSKYPTKKFIFGPHFSVFPDNKMNIINNKYKNAVYIQPSDWVRDIWINRGIKHISVLPFSFPVDTHKFNVQENTMRNKVMVYFKHRNPQELQFLESFLKIKNITYRIFNYNKKYQENDYLNYLQHSKFGIILDAHESQGFAIEEALSCNVPLLVWNAKTMNQEYGSSYASIPCTTIPYWDDRCGEVFDSKDELESKYIKFIHNLDTYEPRQYILDNLSVEVCSKNFINLIQKISSA